jgi:tripartite-type tricarboxylate transporter receptor subunit TctC
MKARWRSALGLSLPRRGRVARIERSSMRAGWGRFCSRNSPPGRSWSLSSGRPKRAGPVGSRPPSPCGGGIRRAWLALCLLASLGVVASAQDNYPSRPVTLIVPYSAGGSIDLVTRIVAEGLTQRLKQSFVVENKPGGNGTIGIGAMVKSAPDGLTLQMGAVGANVTPGLVQKNYPFDPHRDYLPIAMVAEWSAVLVVKKDLPVNTLAEFTAYAKARPGALNWGTTGFGSFAHLVGEVFMQQTGIAMQHVQYKGGSAATTDLLAGTIDAHMMSSPVAAGQAANPRLTMLAVASKRRLSSIQALPTMAEAGVSGVDQTAWLCLFGPPGLPSAIRVALAREIVAIAHDPAYVQKLRNTGFEPLGLDLPATEAMYNDEVARWSAFIKARGLSEQGK